MYPVDCEGGYHEKRLLHDLLDPYNILERPVVNESDPLQLSFGLTLMQIIDVVSEDMQNVMTMANMMVMVFAIRSKILGLENPFHTSNPEEYGAPCSLIS